MVYRRCGKSGLILSIQSLGFWKGFIENGFAVFEAVVTRAFERGIIHYDLADNYGMPLGSAEEMFGRILSGSLKRHRDKLVVSTKCGMYMWEGPYGTGLSKKHIIAGVDNSLRRLKLEYVDIIYLHSQDINTDIDETLSAIDLILTKGKALYLGICNFSLDNFLLLLEKAKQAKIPISVIQLPLSILTYTQYSEYIYEAKRNHIGILSYSPLSQGILSNSFVSRVGRWFTQSTNEKISTQSTRAEKYLHRHEAVNLYRKVLQLDLLAKARNQTLSQMAMAWLFQYQHICSVIMGVRNQTQLDENIFNRNPPGFTTDENCRIHQIVSELKL